ncbi:MAG: LysE family translocator [Alphaproteobacteria bacterium]|nr:LysE family translocator [Alphaproteobacteria bacterium]
MDLISSSALLSFIMTCIIIESTPGPNMAYLAILSLSDGRRAGFAATAGVALGLFIVGLASAVGVAAVISNSPFAYQALRIGGIFYLLWLAWDGWQLERETSPGVARSDKNLQFFKRGLIVNLLNPKAALFYIAILPTFITSTTSSVTYQAILLSVLFVVIATVIHSGVVALASSARTLLEDDKKRLIVRRVLSLALAGVALWFAWTTGKEF